MSNFYLQSISPGLVDTEILPHAYKSLLMLNAADISASVLHAIETPPNVQIHEMIIKPVGEKF